MIKTEATYHKHQKEAEIKKSKKTRCYVDYAFKPVSKHVFTSFNRHRTKYVDTTLSYLMQSKIKVYFTDSVGKFV